MKYPFGTIKDGRRKDIFSIIIFGFPIFSWFRIDFSKEVLGQFSWEKVNFLYILGFHLSTWVGK
jgi:hypothetical protein